MLLMVVVVLLIEIVLPDEGSDGGVALGGVGKRRGMLIAGLA